MAVLGNLYRSSKVGLATFDLRLLIEHIRSNLDAWRYAGIQSKLQYASAMGTPSHWTNPLTLNEMEENFPSYVKADYFLTFAIIGMMTYKLDENVQHSGLSSDSLTIYFSLVSSETNLLPYVQANIISSYSVAHQQHS